MVVAALVLGIVSIVIGVFLSPIGWLATLIGIVGIILAILGKKKDESRKGMATAALVLSIIGAALGLLLYIACVACVLGMADSMGELSTSFEEALMELQ